METKKSNQQIKIQFNCNNSKDLFKKMWKELNTEILDENCAYIIYDMKFVKYYINDIESFHGIYEII
jgi:hypothetical protein